MCSNPWVHGKFVRGIIVNIQFTKFDEELKCERGCVTKETFTGRNCHRNIFSRIASTVSREFILVNPKKCYIWRGCIIANLRESSNFLTSINDDISPIL